MTTSLMQINKAVLCILLILVTIEDVKRLIIPNAYLVCSIAYIAFIALAHSIFNFSYSIIEFIIYGGVIGFLPPFIIMLVSMGGIGFGDVKLLGVCGAFLGYKLSIILLLLSIIIGGIFACFLLAVRYKNKKYMPFAPFITVAYILILFYEERLVDIFDKYYGLL